jgi:hypothetical protein
VQDKMKRVSNDWSFTPEDLKLIASDAFAEKRTGSKRKRSNRRPSFAKPSCPEKSKWPSTLTGFAKDAYNFYVKELRPLGYKLHAEIISFPGGIPGDVGLYLAW